MYRELQEQQASSLAESELSTMKSEIEQRTEETENLKKQLHETRIQARREQQLMISAWYDMSRRINKEVVHNRAFPNSWLGQQRRTLDNQIKRR